MKLLILILSLALLLCACMPQEPVQTDPTQTTTAPSESVSPTETDPTDAPTEPPTDPISSLLRPDAWLTSPLSREDYFAEDKAYSSNQTRWLAETDSGYILYRATLDDGKLTISTDAVAGMYHVPCKKDLSQYSLMVADGAFAYLSIQNQFVRVDLVTGEMQSIPSGDGNAVLRDSRVLYYTQAEGDNIKICRNYLPEGKEEILYTVALEGTPKSWFSFTAPYRTRKALSWSMMNPEFLPRVNKELADPNSKYKNFDNWDFSEYWQDPAALWGNGTPQFILCHKLQDDTGIRALIQYTYDPATDALTQKTGIIDTCWYGSGYPHDHFAPEITELPEPTFLLGDWAAITPVSSRPQSPTADKMYAEEQSFENEQRILLHRTASPQGDLFLLEDGKATRICDRQVQSFIASQHHIYCIADDNTVYQLSFDGSFVQPLYTGKATLSQLCYDRGKLCLVDGTTVMEIDVPKLQYRAVLEHPQIQKIYFIDKGELRVEIYAGLCEIDYHYSPATGELTEDHPWL